jgi:ribosomal protein S18 acetylase RimI-like enzyme
MIRGYAPSDYPSVFEIYRESFGPEFTERLLKDHMQACDAIWVYMRGEKVAGYLLAEKTYLSQIAVSRRRRGEGFGTDLINKFEEHYAAQGVGRVWLQVTVENPSQTLYFKLGYRVTNFEANLYGPGKHGLRMEKQL